jgi:hypothetical protein
VGPTAALAGIDDGVVTHGTTDTDAGVSRSLPSSAPARRRPWRSRRPAASRPGPHPTGSGAARTERSWSRTPTSRRAPRGPRRRNLLPHDHRVRDLTRSARPNRAPVHPAGGVRDGLVSGQVARPRGRARAGRRQVLGEAVVRWSPSLDTSRTRWLDRASSMTRANRWHAWEGA